MTGAAAGIGRATALRFARGGYVVSAWDLDEAGVANLVPELEAAGAPEAEGRKVDVTDPAAADKAVADVVAHFSRVDVLVNNAGIVRDAQLVKWKEGAVVSTMTDADFDKVIAVNLKGVFNCTRAAAPAMIKQGSGVVLNASSVVGLYGNFGQTNYAATKAGVMSFTQTWARELGRFGIRVNAVAPGFIATDIIKAMPEKVIAGMVARTPLGRMGKPEDIAEAYFWLASDAASFVHGATVSVDGGLVIGT